MTRRDMAHRVPLAEHPDHHFVYAEDLTQLSRAEIAKILLGSVIAFLVGWAFVMVLGFVA